jgi:hypothetical protein
MPLTYEGKVDPQNKEPVNPMSIYTSSRNFLGEREDMNYQVETLSIRIN